MMNELWSRGMPVQAKDGQGIKYSETQFLFPGKVTVASYFIDEIIKLQTQIGRLERQIEKMMLK